MSKIAKQLDHWNQTARGMHGETWQEWRADTADAEQELQQAREAVDRAKMELLDHNLAGIREQLSELKRLLG